MEASPRVYYEREKFDRFHCTRVHAEIDKLFLYRKCFFRACQAKTCHDPRKRISMNSKGKRNRETVILSIRL